MRASASNRWRTLGVILVVTIYSLWSFGAFALNGRAFSQSARDAHHAHAAATHAAHEADRSMAQVSATDARHQHAAGEHTKVPDRMDDQDHDHADSKATNCCGAACIPALAAQSLHIAFADRVTSPIPTRQAVDRIADAPTLHYRPPIAL